MFSGTGESFVAGVVHGATSTDKFCIAKRIDRDFGVALIFVGLGCVLLFFGFRKKKTIP
jgi:hypothetical protein